MNSTPGPSSCSRTPSARLASLVGLGTLTNDGKTECIRQLSGADLSTEPDELARLFPGRWNARRELAPGLDALVRAAGTALEEAGWWRRGQEALVEGGLVVGTDTHGLGVSRSYARELAREGASGISPSSFLFALPSSAAAVLGILFGLKSFQSTITEGRASGFRALRHALDMIHLGRVERLVVTCFSRVTPEIFPVIGGGELQGEVKPDYHLELAVAVCLERLAEGDGARGPVLALEEKSAEAPAGASAASTLLEGLRGLREGTGAVDAGDGLRLTLR